jgi:hypothetical protein
MEGSTSDKIRQYVYVHYILPSRLRQEQSVSVRAGDVAKALHLRGRVILVCQAMRTLKLEKQFGVKLSGRSGSATAANATFTFDVASKQ